MQVINSIYNKNKIITTLDNNIKDIEGKKIDKIIYHNSEPNYYCWVTDAHYISHNRQSKIKIICLDDF